MDGAGARGQGHGRAPRTRSPERPTPAARGIADRHDDQALAWRGLATGSGSAAQAADDVGTGTTQALPPDGVLRSSRDESGATGARPRTRSAWSACADRAS